MMDVWYITPNPNCNEYLTYELNLNEYDWIPFSLRTNASPYLPYLYP